MQTSYLSPFWLPSQVHGVTRQRWQAQRAGPQHRRTQNEHTDPWTVDNGSHVEPQSWFSECRMNSFFPLCVGTTYMHLCLCWPRLWPVLDLWRLMVLNHKPQSPLITCLINTMGRRTSSGVCSNGPQGPRLIQTACSIRPQPAHFTVCHAPGQTAQHQFMLNNSREENKDLSCLWTAKDGSSIPFFS